MLDKALSCSCQIGTFRQSLCNFSTRQPRDCPYLWQDGLVWAFLLSAAHASNAKGIVHVRCKELSSSPLPTSGRQPEVRFQPRGIRWEGSTGRPLALVPSWWNSSAVANFTRVFCGPFPVLWSSWWIAGPSEIVHCRIGGCGTRSLGLLQCQEETRRDGILTSEHFISSF